jgi:hypothetical protein
VYGRSFRSADLMPWQLQDSSVLLIGPINCYKRDEFTLHSLPIRLRCGQATFASAKAL